MQALADFLAPRPAVRQLFSKMNGAGIRWAIFAGTQLGIMTGNRQPTDLDIIIHNDDFDALAALLPEAKVTKNQIDSIETGDGEHLEGHCSTITASLDGIDIDIMASHVFKAEEGSFPTSLTNTAVKNRLSFNFQGELVYFVAPFDTILIKAFMRRGAEQNKFDVSDAKMLAQQFPPDSEYVKARIAETGLTTGARKLLQELQLI